MHSETSMIKASARMMPVYRQALHSLNRLRTRGKQIVSVEHINVGSGGHGHESVMR